MSPTDLRTSLTSVSDAVPVPAPDLAALESRVTRARRRRTAVRSAGAAAAVVLVAAGSTLLGDRSERPQPADPVVPPVEAVAVPVTVDGELAYVGTSLERTGLRVTDVVGTTTAGTVVLGSDGELVRVDGERVTPLANGVRRAFLDGDAVVRQDRDGTIAWSGGTPPAPPEAGDQLVGAGTGRYVVSRGSALYAVDAEGAHRLWYAPSDEPSVLHLPVDVGGDRVAVRADDELTVFAADGLHSGTVGGGVRLGALAPDGSAYARTGEGGRGLQLLDPRALDAAPVRGPVGRVVDLRWDGTDLLVVASGGHALWRCAEGSDCSELYADPSVELGL